MTYTNKIAVKKELYVWAINESQISIDEIRDRFKDVDDWINNDAMPTFKQLEKFANYLKIPFGYLFLDEPPKTDIIEGEFRTIGNKVPTISKNLKDTIYLMSRKKDWLSDYRKENGWDIVVGNSNNEFKSMSYMDSVEYIKRFIKLDEHWYNDCKDSRAGFEYLRDKIENSGIVVMQNGIVGANTHRKLDVKEFRGFMLYDSYAPLIFINSNDSQNGKIFTLIHELTHVLIGEDDIFIDEKNHLDNAMERKVNRIVAEILLPTDHINKNWKSDFNAVDQIEALSKRFKVSRIAVAIKLRQMNLISHETVAQIREMTDEDVESKSKGTGGDYWRSYHSRYSKSFLEAVVQGAEAGDISYRYAFNLMDVKAKSYDIVKESMVEHG
jgi:Zn-dependent peptidase ImmA (M78 family)